MVLGYNNRRARTWAYYDLDKTPSSTETNSFPSKEGLNGLLHDHYEWSIFFTFFFFNMKTSINISNITTLSLLLETNSEENSLICSFILSLLVEICGTTYST